jgi:hypothetical protein
MIQLQDLRPDGKIAIPGFYQIEMDRHHGQPCDGISVTSGVLRRMIQHGPQYTWAFHRLNPDCRDEPDTQPKAFGRAMATALELGIGGLKTLYKAVDEGAPSRPTATQRKAFEAKGYWSKNAQRRVDWWEEFDARPGELITQGQLSLITDMATALLSDENKELAQVALGGIPELDMAWKDTKSGLWALSRLDNISGDGVLVDYKTIDPGGEPFDWKLCDRKIDKLGYYQQGAFGATGWRQLTGNDPSAVAILFQSVKWPHACILREIQPHYLRLGQLQNRYAMDRFAECLELDDWPGPGRDVGAYQMAPWLEEKIEREMNTLSLEEDQHD